MEKRIPIGLKLPPSLVAAVDGVRARYEFPPSRTEVIERMLEAWVASQDKAMEKKKPKESA